MATTKIPELDFELTDAETVRLEQGGAFGEAVVIDLHAIHVRLLAQRMGILKGDPDQARRVQALERRLHVLRDRIDVLADALLAAAAKGHECLDEECALSGAALDLANEWCAECAPLERDATPSNATERQPRQLQLQEMPQ